MAEAGESVAALKKRGLELAQGNRLDEAKALYTRVVDQCPDDAEAWCVLSTINGCLGRIDEAETCCRRALALREDYGEAHMNLGNVLTAQGRYDEALGQYRKVLELHPGHPIVHCNVGYVQSALGNFEDAAASYQAAIDLKPQLPEAHFNLGNIRERQRRFDDAEQAFRQALALNPGHTGAWHNLGLVLSRQGRADEAEAAYREALRLDPTFAKAHHSLGHLLQELGRLPEAEVSYREALQHATDYDEAHNSLGDVLAAQGRLDEAAQCYEAVLARGPNPFSHCNLGNVRQRQQRLDEAIVHYRQALALEPGRAEFYNNLGNTLRQQGLYADAKAALAEALRLNPDYAEAHANLGKLLLESGADREEAAASYRRALALKPDFATAAAGEAGILEKQGEFERAYSRLEPFLRAEVPSVAIALVFASVCRPLGRCGDAITLLGRVLGNEGEQLHVSDCIPLHFALGRLLDAAGEYDRAFAHYQQANDLTDRRLDLQQHIQRNEAIMATYSKAFMAGAPRAANDSQRPVFIVGMPRSGTSLVEQILASHAAVFGGGELEEMNRIVAELAARALYPQCVESLSSDRLTQLAARYLDYIDGLAGPEAVRVTDKMPSNYLHLGLIRLLFPEARVIHCVRDPLDTCLSCYFQNFDERLPYTYNLRQLGAYYAHYRRLMDHWRSVLDGPFLELQYEDLVADQEGVSRTLVEFCGLEWDPRCLRFYETRRAVATASYDQVRRPLYNSSVGRWRHYERHLGPLREALAQGG